MPFLTYQVERRRSGAQRRPPHAGRRRGGRQARRRQPVLDVVTRLVDVGIPVMGHLGLQPQSVHQVGGYVKSGHQRARRRRAARRCARARAGRRLCDRARVDSVGRRTARSPNALDIPDDRHRRGARLRRPGARQLRHARTVRRPRSVVRQAVRASHRDGRSAAARAYIDDVHEAGRYARPALDGRRARRRRRRRSQRRRHDRRSSATAEGRARRRAGRDRPRPDDGRAARGPCSA